MKKYFYFIAILLFSVSTTFGIGKVHIPVPKTANSAKSVIPDKINNTPSIIFFYEKNGIETKGYGFRGPDNASKNIIYMINDESPLVGQTFKIDSILTNQNVTVGNETIVADIVTLVLADMGSGALFTEQTDDPTISSEAGYFYGATTSGDFFYKSTTGLYNISTGTFIPNVTIPTVVSITIPATGTTAEVITSESTTVGVGGSGGWTLNNPTVGMTYVEGNGLAGTPLVFNLARTVLSPATENPDASYVQPTNGFESADDGVDLASIPNVSVTNNSTQIGGSVKDVNSVFYYTADNTGGELVAETYTGTTSGTLTTATITTGYNHTTGGTKALTGAGTADTTSNIAFTASETGFDSSNGFVTCWIYPTSTTDDNQFFGADYDASNYIRAWVETDRTVKLYYYGGSLSALISGDTVNLNEPNKIDLRWNTTSNRISVRINDGAWADKTDVDISTFSSAPATITIGNSRSTNGFFGYVDDFELWRKDDQSY